MLATLLAPVILINCSKACCRQFLISCTAATVCPVAAAQYEQIAQEIEQIQGVITHGLLLGVADAVVVADPKQGVRVLEPKAAAAPSSS
jgi:hypothetical protein